MSALATQAVALGDAQKKTIASKAVSSHETSRKQFPQGAVQLFLNGPTDQLKDLATGTWQVKAGMSPHDIHRHPEEELLIFVEGEGEIEISGARQTVAPGSVMYCAANLPHGVFNSSKSDMLFYFVKWKA